MNTHKYKIVDSNGKVFGKFKLKCTALNWLYKIKMPKKTYKRMLECIVNSKGLMTSKKFNLEPLYF